jgi:hypothetical protein
VLSFLNFPKYSSNYQSGNKLEVHISDQIRGDFYALFYIAYTSLEFFSREIVLALAKKWTDQLYHDIQDKITKAETFEEMAEGSFGKGCLKTHNLVVKVENNRLYEKVTRCFWAEIYAELPDLELASLLECYGDFSKMQYINPNFALSRTKTLVEGFSYCDFVHYDKRIENEIRHPDEDFWKSF